MQQSPGEFHKDGNFIKGFCGLYRTGTGTGNRHRVILCFSSFKFDVFICAVCFCHTGLLEDAIKTAGLKHDLVVGVKDYDRYSVLLTNFFTATLLAAWDAHLAGATFDDADAFLEVSHLLC